MGKCRYDLSEDCHDRDCLDCVLNKIQAELLLREESIKVIRKDNNCFFTANEIIKIIDKYKAESEDKESCDNCKHNTDSWDSDACDGCCGANSKWSGEIYPGEFEAMEHNGRMDALESEEQA